MIFLPLNPKAGGGGGEGMKDERMDWGAVG